MPETFDPYRKWLGIPPKDQPPNHYRLLAIELFEDDPDVIEAAADARMAHVRTYQTGQNSAVSQKILNELAQAKLCLLDRAKKAAYDAELRSRQAGASGVGGAAAPSPSGIGQPTAAASSPSLRKARSLSQPAQTPVPLVATQTRVAHRRRGQPLWLLPAALATGVVVVGFAGWAILRLTGPAAGPAPASDSVSLGGGAKTTRPQTSSKSTGSKSVKKSSRSRARSTTADTIVLVADSNHPPSAPGVVADRIVIWNQHNSSHNDRGTRECNVCLLRDGQEVWRQDQIVMPWSRDRDENVSINIPQVRFDRVRVEVTKWEQLSGGLAEVEVYRGDTNLARGCPATACAQINERYPAAKLTDGVTTSYFDCYWLLPDKMPGWAEIDLSFAEPRATAGLQAEKLIIWNTHNSRHNDRGAVALSVRMLLGQKEVWRQDDISITWLPDQDTSLEVALPQMSFDRVRVEVTRWPALGAGLSEVQVLAGDLNLARACPVISSGCLNHNFRAEKAVDGITSSLAEEVGYWCTPDRSGGWIEIDLSCNLAEIGRANRQLGAYRALVGHDWPRGLPWLARTDARELRKLALLDAGNPGDPNQLKAVGDGWWDVALASEDAARPPLRERAIYRYAQAAARLGELDRARPLERVNTSLPLPDGTPLFLLHETELQVGAPLREPVVVLRGVPRRWGFWMHASSNRSVLAAFALTKRYRRLAGAAAINDTAQQRTNTPLVFRVAGDGRTIWTSRPLQELSSMEPFDVEISGVDRLELIVDCPGDAGYGHAVWIDPVLDPSSAWPRIEAGESPTRLAEISPAMKTSSSPDKATSTPTASPPEPAPEGNAGKGKPPSLADLLQPSDKLAPPDEPARKEAEQSLKQEFKVEWSGKGASGKLGAARTLRAAAEKLHEAPTEQFVLLSQACDLAAADGDYAEAEAIIDLLAERFDVSPLAMRAEALTRMNRAQKLAPQKQNIVDEALFLAADAVQSDDYDSAEQAAKLAGSAARGADDAGRAEAARQCLKEVTALSRRYDAVRPSLERLAASFDDAEANLKVGQFECMLKQDWQRGLPRLARGNDEKLRQLAEQDLQTPVDSLERLKLAQAWLDRAEELKDEIRRGCQLRALEWFERARPGCRGAEREQAEKRIAEIRGGTAFKSRSMRWLERLLLGIEFEDEMNCAVAARMFELNKTFDLGKSWVLSLDFMPRDFKAPGLVFFTGDDRGGRDPLYVSVVDDGRLFIGISDSHRVASSYGLSCPLAETDNGQWKHVRVVYRSDDRSVVVELDGQQVTEGVLSFTPAFDRPMPCWIGGANANDQRFKGKVRGVRLSN